MKQRYIKSEAEIRRKSCINKNLVKGVFREVKKLSYVGDKISR